MNSIALTGATSMIGVALINECIKNNVKVYAFVRKNSKNLRRLPKSPLLTIFECNLDGLKEFDVSCIKSKIDCFYHIGWSYTDKESRSSCNKQVKNIEFTIDAVQLANKLCCRKFIGAGSQAEYGLINEPLNGHTLCNPITAYGAAKNSAFHLSKIETKKLSMDFNWVRILSIYGVNDDNNTLIKTFIRKCKSNESFPLSPCTHIWDYLYEKDAGNAFLLIGNKGVSGKTYCLGSGNGKPLKDYIEIIKDIVNPEYRINYGELEHYENIQNNLVADIKELSDDTTWTPRIKFENGITDVIRCSL